MRIEFFKNYLAISHLLEHISIRAWTTLKHALVCKSHIICTTWRTTVSISPHIQRSFTTSILAVPIAGSAPVSGTMIPTRVYPDRACATGSFCCPLALIFREVFRTNQLGIIGVLISSRFIDAQIVYYCSCVQMLGCVMRWWKVDYAFPLRANMIQTSNHPETLLQLPDLANDVWFVSSSVLRVFYWKNWRYN